MRVLFPFILGIMGGLAIFGRLGCPLLEPEEARYAEIPRQMLAESRIIVPVWQGQPYLHKPPLLYWLVMGCYELFGVNDVAARLVPCLAAWLTLMAVYFWTARRAGPAAAGCAGLLLCFTAGFIYRGPMLSMDSLLTLFIVVGLWCAHEMLTLPNAPSRRAWVWWLLSAVSCGLGVLTKGPVAAVLIVVPIMFFQALTRRAAVKRWLAYFTVTTFVAAPWYLAVAWQEPEALWDFIWLHNAQRFATPFDHAEPWWYYAPVLLVALVPGSLLLPWIVLGGLRRKGVSPQRWTLHASADKKTPSPGTPGGERNRVTQPVSARRMSPSATLLAGLGGVCCLVFFSLAGCKRTGYILPALPLLAMSIGICFHERLGRVRGFGARPVLIVLLAVVFGLELFAVYRVLPAYHERFSMRAEVRGHRDTTFQPEVSVACYPRGWDSVPFYLNGAKVEIYARAGTAKLAAALQADRPLLLFVKAAHLHEVRDLLPTKSQVHWSPGRNVAVVVVSPVRALAVAGSEP